MQLKRIVIGVDLTTSSTGAAKWVADAFAPEAEVVLLHCLNPLVLERRVADMRAKAESSLDELRRAVGVKRSSYRIRIGDPVRCLADLAGEVDADLIAVGAHEEHPDRLPALGSTAERLVRCSPVPVLLCTATASGVPRSVLLPVDSVDVTTELATWTSSLAEQFGARLALVHIEGTRDRDLPPGAAHERPGVSATTWSRVARELPPHRVFVDAVLGERADAVLSEARRFHTELVLLQAPDDCQADGATDRVLRESECPVLVIPSGDNARLMDTR